MVRLSSFNPCLLTLYLLPGNGQQTQQINSDRLYSLYLFLRTLATPWLILADWNMLPSEVCQHMVITSLGGKVVTSSLTSTTRSAKADGSIVMGRHIDFAVAAASIADHIGLNGGMGCSLFPSRRFADHSQLQWHHRGDLSTSLGPSSYPTLLGTQEKGVD